MKFPKYAPSAALLAIALLMPGCGGGNGDSIVQSSHDGGPPMSAEATVGQKAFQDASLSASGRLSCATCHSPAAGHASANDLAVQLGGAGVDQQGTRSTPTLRYLVANGAFHFDDQGTPTGGFFWDGRSDSLALQAGGPLLNTREMANASRADVVARIAAASWSAQFAAVYGDDIFNDVDRAFLALTAALQRYQQEDIEFHAFTSKYDAVLAGTTQLTVQEARGLALFNDPAKGNCASCHTSAQGSDGSHPLFTDFTYDNLGVPRNMEIAANADPAYFDLGLCGRPELATRVDLCGFFKVPTLRNVGLKHAFFHNGRFKTLKDVLTFYVQRDTNPERFYPLNPDGSFHKFDDIAPNLAGNVNTSEAPYNRSPGQAPALTDADIDDVIAFLQTLTDGWSVGP